MARIATDRRRRTPRRRRASVALDFSPAEVRAYYAARVPDLKPGGGELRGPCPVHKGKRDSFAVNPQNGQAYCHSQCAQGWDMIGLNGNLRGPRSQGRETIFRIVGRASAGNENRNRASPLGSRMVATYDYTDERGALLYQTIRFDPKDFKQRRPDGKGGWIWNLKGVRLALYRLPELLKRKAETVFICEGEKDVDRLAALGLLATCNPMGAGKWREEYAATLQGEASWCPPRQRPIH